MNTDLPFDIVELVPCPMTPTPQASPLRETSFRADTWLPEDIDRLCALFRADEDLVGIAPELDRTLTAVRSKVAELGLRRNSQRPWSTLEDEELARRYGVDATSAIASDFGRSSSAIHARAGLLGLTEGNAQPYSDWEVAQIRAGYRGGVPVSQLAALLGRPICGIASVASRLELVHANAPHDWSAAEHRRALELAEAGVRYRRIAVELATEGFPPRRHNAVGQVLRKLGYGRGWGRPFIPEEDDLLRAAYAGGASLAPLRTRLARSAHSIRWRAKVLDLQGTHPRPNGWRTEPPWTEDEISVLQRDYGKVPTPQIAANLGRGKGGVFNKAWSLGLVHGYIRPFSEDERQAIRIAYDVGLSLTDLSLALRRDVAVVSKHAIRMDLHFSLRPNKAPRTARALRPALALADILRLKPIGQADAPGRSFKAKGTRRMPPPMPLLIAGPGAPQAPAQVLEAMLAAGLLRAFPLSGAALLMPAQTSSSAPR